MPNVSTLARFYEGKKDTQLWINALSIRNNEIHEHEDVKKQ